MAEQEFTTEELEREEWRPVVAYEDHYSVSSLGRVRRDKGGVFGARVGRILKTTYNNSRAQVSLCQGGEHRTIPLRNVAAESFLEADLSSVKVKPKDGNYRNCRLVNLILIEKNDGRRL